MEVCFQPCTPKEVGLRLKLAILRNHLRKPLISSHGVILIDCDRYEVTLKGLRST
ncbi:MAG: hypothetical protein Ct9H300mP19_18840 [Dehalococcoidia bacterium]|nr:MAG: hypothetical protein Ct9H300mP19_18840 [Dehalococcoidia bacterium]